MAGGKGGVAKAIGRGAAAAGTIALGMGSGGTLAIAGAAAIGGASGFTTNVVKSWAMENVVPKDYQSLEGITSEAPTDARKVGADIADGLPTLGGHQENDVTTTETGGEGEAGPDDGTASETEFKGDDNEDGSTTDNQSESE